MQQQTIKSEIDSRHSGRVAFTMGNIYVGPEVQEAEEKWLRDGGLLKVVINLSEW